MKKTSYKQSKTFLGDGKISYGTISASKVSIFAEKSFEKSNSCSQKNQALPPRQ
ncbi:MAG: hypothetical protein V8S22_04615 [Lachnospiraceae bacterium]